MRTFLSVLIITLFNLLAFLFFFLYFNGRDTSDYLVGRSIPKYPFATEYKVRASSGFPDGFPSGSISFKTNDKAEQVINYYRNKLTENNWEPISNDAPLPKAWYPIVSDIYEATFQKVIGLQKFIITIKKSEPQSGENIKNTEEVNIFIRRRI